jgi:hypothetical protein
MKALAFLGLLALCGCTEEQAFYARQMAAAVDDYADRQYYLRHGCGATVVIVERQEPSVRSGMIVGPNGISTLSY